MSWSQKMSGSLCNYGYLPRYRLYSRVYFCIQIKCPGHKVDLAVRILYFKYLLRDLERPVARVAFSPNLSCGVGTGDRMEPISKNSEVLYESTTRLQTFWSSSSWHLLSGRCCTDVAETEHYRVKRIYSDHACKSANNTVLYLDVQFQILDSMKRDLGELARASLVGQWRKTHPQSGCVQQEFRVVLITWMQSK